MNLNSGVADSHIDAALTNMSLQLPLDQGLIQDEVCPSHKVMHESDKYFVFERVSAKTYNVNVGLGAEINQFKMALSTDSYSCDEYGIGSALAFRTIKNQDQQIDLEESAVEDATRIIRFAKERRVQSLIQTTGNWDGTKAVTSSWNSSSADIEADMDAATIAFHLQAGVMPNVAVISLKVYRAIIAWLRQRPSAMTYSEYRNVEFTLSDSGVASQLSGLFNIPKWVVGVQISDSAAIGEDFSGSYMWSDMVTLLFIKKDAGRRDKTALKCFTAEDLTVRKYVDKGKRSIIVEVTHIVDEKIVATSLGYTLTNIIS